MLVAVLAEHRGPLRASLLAEYGLHLEALPEHYDAVMLADVVASLRPGCALWRATGGHLAWSDEMHLLAAVKHGLDVLAWQKSGNPPRKSDYPKPIEPPPLAHDAQARERQLTDKRERRIARRAERNQSRDG
jgi:hypothetical protein